MYPVFFLYLEYYIILNYFLQMFMVKNLINISIMLNM